MPQFLSELSKYPDRGLSSEQLDELTEKVRLAQKSAAPFRMAVTLPGSSRSLALRGSLADNWDLVGRVRVPWSLSDDAWTVTLGGGLALEWHR